MQRLEVSGAVRPIYWSLGVKRLKCTLSIGNDGADWIILYPNRVKSIVNMVINS